MWPSPKESDCPCEPRFDPVSLEDWGMWHLTRRLPSPRAGRWRSYTRWSEEEEQALRLGVQRHGLGKWKRILADSEFATVLSTRSNVDLKVRLGETCGLALRIEPEPGAKAQRAPGVARTSSIVRGPTGGLTQLTGCAVVQDKWRTLTCAETGLKPVGPRAGRVPAPHPKPTPTGSCARDLHPSVTRAPLGRPPLLPSGHWGRQLEGRASLRSGKGTELILLLGSLASGATPCRCCCRKMNAHTSQQLRRQAVRAASKAQARGKTAV